MDRPASIRNYYTKGYTFFLFFLLFLQSCQPVSQKPLKGSVTPIPANKITPLVQKTSKSPTATLQPTSQIKINQAELQGVTLQLWHSWSGLTRKALEESVTKFNANNPWGVKIEASFQGSADELNDKVKAAINTGQFPNLIISYPYQALSWAVIRKDILVDINPYVEDAEWGISVAERKDFHPEFWKTGFSGKTMIGFPVLGSGQVLLYNQTWASELGLSQLPVTEEAFKNQVCAAAKANLADKLSDNDKTGGYLITTDFSTTLGWLGAFDAQVLKVDGKGYQFRTPETMKAFAYLRNLFEGGCAWEPESYLVQTSFATRLGLVASSNIADLPMQKQAFSMANNRDEWVVLGFPGPKGEPFIDVYAATVHVLRSTPEEELAGWLFARWLTAPENQASLAAASSHFPVRISTAAEPPEGLLPQWSAALKLLDHAQAEPALQSWGNVRWAVSDAMHQIYLWYFTQQQLPDMIKLLDDTATDLNNQGK